MVESNQAILNASFNLLRRLPPQNVEMNIAGLSQLISDENTKDEVIQKVDQPLEIEIDTTVGREFLKCEYNRDGDSYRSPWTNSYFPPTGEDAIYPS